MKQAKFMVVGNPIAKKRPRFVRRGDSVGTYNPQQDEEKKFLADCISVHGMPIDKLQFTEWVSISMEFHVARPKSHYTGAGVLKTVAPLRRHSQKPDLDNLVKFVMDCLNHVPGLWRDDCVVSAIIAEKVWAEEPKTIISLNGV